MADAVEQQTPTQQPGDQPPAPPTPPAQATPPAAPVSPPAPSSEPAVVEDDKGFIRLPARDFKKRVAKSTRKELREIGKEFGLEFPSGMSRETMTEALKARQADYVRLKAAEEETKRAQMTEREKYEADKARAERTARHAVRRMEKVQDKRRVERWDRRINRFASEHVAPGQESEVIKILKSELRGDRKLLKRLNPKRHHGERHLREWFENKVKSVPGFAKPSASAPVVAAPQAEDLVQQLYPGKTMRAGQANSLNPAEVAHVMAVAGQPPQREPKPMSHGAPPSNARVAPARPGGDSDLVQSMFPGKTMRANQANSLTTAEVAQVQQAMLRRPPPVQQQ
jgi:hypothetical protein